MKFSWCLVLAFCIYSPCICVGKKKVLDEENVDMEETTEEIATDDGETTSTIRSKEASEEVTEESKNLYSDEYDDSSKDTAKSGTKIPRERKSKKILSNGSRSILFDRQSANMKNDTSQNGTTQNMTTKTTEVPHQIEIKKITHVPEQKDKIKEQSHDMGRSFETNKDKDITNTASTAASPKIYTSKITAEPTRILITTERTVIRPTATNSMHKSKEFTAKQDNMGVGAGAFGVGPVTNESRKNETFGNLHNANKTNDTKSEEPVLTDFGRRKISKRIAQKECQAACGHQVRKSECTLPDGSCHCVNPVGPPPRCRGTRGYRQCEDFCGINQISQLCTSYLEIYCTCFKRNYKYVP